MCATVGQIHVPQTWYAHALCRLYGPYMWVACFVYTVQTAGGRGRWVCGTDFQVTGIRSSRRRVHLSSVLALQGGAVFLRVDMEGHLERR